MLLDDSFLIVDVLLLGDHNFRPLLLLVLHSIPARFHISYDSFLKLLFNLFDEGLLILLVINILLHSLCLLLRILVDKFLECIVLILEPDTLIRNDGNHRLSEDLGNSSCILLIVFLKPLHEIKLNLFIFVEHSSISLIRKGVQEN